MSIIELNGVHKSYGANSVLCDINLSIQKGEMVAVTGNSGAGKSTLLNIIGLMETPDSGDVVISGKKNPRMNGKTTVWLQRNVIGYLFQNYALVDNMSVNKNLDIALKYSKIKDKDHSKMNALKKVGLSDKISNKVYQLSGGEQQRIAIARLMLKQCEIILADEPTGSLDSHNRDIVIHLLKKFNELGKTIVIVTHDPIVAEICERTITL